jgi:hypothetical protein
MNQDKESNERIAKKVAGRKATILARKLLESYSA